jgi:hypothetical protein
MPYESSQGVSSIQGFELNSPKYLRAQSELFDIAQSGGVMSPETAGLIAYLQQGSVPPGFVKNLCKIFCPPRAGTLLDVAARGAKSIELFKVVLGLLKNEPDAKSLLDEMFLDNAAGGSHKDMEHQEYVIRCCMVELLVDSEVDSTGCLANQIMNGKAKMAHIMLKSFAGDLNSSMAQVRDPLVLVASQITKYMCPIESASVCALLEALLQKGLDVSATDVTHKPLAMMPGYQTYYNQFLKLLDTCSNDQAGWEKLAEFLAARNRTWLKVIDPATGMSPFHVLAQRGCSYLLEMIYKDGSEEGVAWNYKKQHYADHSRLRRTPLHHAVMSGNAATYSCIAHQIPPAYINEADDDGNTALHLAIINACDRDMLEAVIDSGVDRERENRAGVCARDIKPRGWFQSSPLKKIEDEEALILAEIKEILYVDISKKTIPNEARIIYEKKFSELQSAWRAISRGPLGVRTGILRDLMRMVSDLNTEFHELIEQAKAAENVLREFCTAKATSSTLHAQKCRTDEAYRKKHISEYKWIVSEDESRADAYFDLVLHSSLALSGWPDIQLFIQKVEYLADCIEGSCNDSMYASITPYLVTSIHRILDSKRVSGSGKQDDCRGEITKFFDKMKRIGFPMRLSHVSAVFSRTVKYHASNQKSLVGRQMVTSAPEWSIQLEDETGVLSLSFDSQAREKGEVSAFVNLLIDLLITEELSTSSSESHDADKLSFFVSVMNDAMDGNKAMKWKGVEFSENHVLGDALKKRADLIRRCRAIADNFVVGRISIRNEPALEEQIQKAVSRNTCYISDDPFTEYAHTRLTNRDHPKFTHGHYYLSISELMDTLKHYEDAQSRAIGDIAKLMQDQWTSGYKAYSAYCMLRKRRWWVVEPTLCALDKTFREWIEEWQVFQVKHDPFEEWKTFRGLGSKELASQLLYSYGKSYQRFGSAVTEMQRIVARVIETMDPQLRRMVDALDKAYDGLVNRVSIAGEKYLKLRDDVQQPDRCAIHQQRSLLLQTLWEQLNLALSSNKEIRASNHGSSDRSNGRHKLAQGEQTVEEGLIERLRHYNEMKLGYSKLSPSTVKCFEKAVAETSAAADKQSHALQAATDKAQQAARKAQEESAQRSIHVDCQRIAGEVECMNKRIDALNARVTTTPIGVCFDQSLCDVLGTLAKELGAGYQNNKRKNVLIKCLPKLHLGSSIRYYPAEPDKHWQSLRGVGEKILQANAYIDELLNFGDMHHEKHIAMIEKCLGHIKEMRVMEGCAVGIDKCVRDIHGAINKMHVSMKSDTLVTLNESACHSYAVLSEPVLADFHQHRSKFLASYLDTIKSEVRRLMESHSRGNAVGWDSTPLWALLKECREKIGAEEFSETDLDKLQSAARNAYKIIHEQIERNKSRHEKHQSVIDFIRDQVNPGLEKLSKYWFLGDERWWTMFLQKNCEIVGCKHVRLFEIDLTGKEEIISAMHRNNDKIVDIALRTMVDQVDSAMITSQRRCATQHKQERLIFERACFNCNVEIDEVNILLSNDRYKHTSLITDGFIVRWDNFRRSVEKKRWLMPPVKSSARALQKIVIHDEFMAVKNGCESAADLEEMMSKREALRQLSLELVRFKDLGIKKVHQQDSAERVSKETLRQAMNQLCNEISICNDSIEPLNAILSPKGPYTQFSEKINGLRRLLKCRDNYQATISLGTSTKSKLAKLDFNRERYSRGAKNIDVQAVDSIRAQVTQMREEIIRETEWLVLLCKKKEFVEQQCQQFQICLKLLHDNEWYSKARINPCFREIEKTFLCYQAELGVDATTLVLARFSTWEKDSPPMLVSVNEIIKALGQDDERAQVVKDIENINKYLATLSQYDDAGARSILCDPLRILVKCPGSGLEPVDPVCLDDALRPGYEWSKPYNDLKEMLNSEISRKVKAHTAKLAATFDELKQLCNGCNNEIDLINEVVKEDRGFDSEVGVAINLVDPLRRKVAKPVSMFSSFRESNTKQLQRIRLDKTDVPLTELEQLLDKTKTLSDVFKKTLARMDQDRKERLQRAQDNQEKTAEMIDPLLHELSAVLVELNQKNSADVDAILHETQLVDLSKLRGRHTPIELTITRAVSQEIGIEEREAIAASLNAAITKAKGIISGANEYDLALNALASAVAACNAEITEVNSRLSDGKVHSELAGQLEPALKLVGGTSYRKGNNQQSSLDKFKMEATRYRSRVQDSAEVEAHQQAVDKIKVAISHEAKTLGDVIGQKDELRGCCQHYASDMSQWHSDGLIDRSEQKEMFSVIDKAFKQYAVRLQQVVTVKDADYFVRVIAEASAYKDKIDSIMAERTQQKVQESVMQKQQARQKVLETMINEQINPALAKLSVQGDSSGVVDLCKLFRAMVACKNTGIDAISIHECREKTVAEYDAATEQARQLIAVIQKTQSEIDAQARQAVNDQVGVLIERCGACDDRINTINSMLGSNTNMDRQLMTSLDELRDKVKKTPWLGLVSSKASQLQIIDASLAYCQQTYSDQQQVAVLIREAVSMNDSLLGQIEAIQAAQEAEAKAAELERARLVEEQAAEAEAEAEEQAAKSAAETEERAKLDQERQGHFDYLEIAIESVTARLNEIRRNVGDDIDVIDEFVELLKPVRSYFFCQKAIPLSLDVPEKNHDFYRHSSRERSDEQLNTADVIEERYAAIRKDRIKSITTENKQFKASLTGYNEVRSLESEKQSIESACVEKIKVDYREYMQLCKGQDGAPSLLRLSDMAKKIKTFTGDFDQITENTDQILEYRRQITELKARFSELEVEPDTPKFGKVKDLEVAFNESNKYHSDVASHAADLKKRHDSLQQQYQDALERHDQSSQACQTIREEIRGQHLELSDEEYVLKQEIVGLLGENIKALSPGALGQYQSRLEAQQKAVRKTLAAQQEAQEAAKKTEAVQQHICSSQESCQKLLAELQEIDPSPVRDLKREQKSIMQSRPADNIVLSDLIDFQTSIENFQKKIQKVQKERQRRLGELQSKVASKTTEIERQLKQLGSDSSEINAEYMRDIHAPVFYHTLSSAQQRFNQLNAFGAKVTSAIAEQQRVETEKAALAAAERAAAALVEAQAKTAAAKILIAAVDKVNDIAGRVNGCLQSCHDLALDVRLASRYDELRRQLEPQVEAGWSRLFSAAPKTSSRCKLQLIAYDSKVIVDVNSTKVSELSLLLNEIVTEVESAEKKLQAEMGKLSVAKIQQQINEKIDLLEQRTLSPSELSEIKRIKNSCFSELDKNTTLLKDVAQLECQVGDRLQKEWLSKEEEHPKHEKSRQSSVLDQGVVMTSCLSDRDSSGPFCPASDVDVRVSEAKAPSRAAGFKRCKEKFQAIIVVLCQDLDDCHDVILRCKVTDSERDYFDRFRRLKRHIDDNSECPDDLLVKRIISFNVAVMGLFSQTNENIHKSNSETAKNQFLLMDHSSQNRKVVVCSAMLKAVDKIKIEYCQQYYNLMQDIGRDPRGMAAAFKEFTAKPTEKNCTIC